jgi:imidazolonepropionase-like amidohydrolase
MLASWLVLSILSGASGPPDVRATSDETVWIRAERVIVRPGVELEDAAILIRDGVIVRVGTDVEAPEGARRIEGAVACAGFVDGWSSLEVDPASASDAGTTAGTRTVDAVDPYSRRDEREEALRGGVTSTRAQAGRSSSIGGVGAVLHTETTPRASVLLADACVAASVGITRKGRKLDVFERVEEVERLIGQLEKGRSHRESAIEYRHDLAEWEKAIAEKREELEDDFKKAKKKRDKELAEAEEEGKELKEKKYKEDKKPKRPRFDPNIEIMARVAEGELPLVVEVHRAPELRGLLEKSEDFDRLRLIVAGATEALHLADELAEHDVPVLLWPTPEAAGRSEYARHDLALAGELDRAGVEVLLGSGGGTAARDLRLLAALAIGHGLDAEAALHAITLGPARAFDVADQVGSLERGKKADVLVFDGDPLDTTSRLEFVVSAGRVAFE